VQPLCVNFWKFIEYEIFLEVEETTAEFLVCFELSGEGWRSDGASTVPGRIGHLEFQNFEIRQNLSFFRRQKYNESDDWREIYLCPSKQKG